MLATAASTLQVVNIGLLIAGGLAFLGFVRYLVRSGRWRNPLAGVELPHYGPSILTVAAVLLAFLAFEFTGLSLLGQGGSPVGDAGPGSDAWHRANLADAVSHVLVAGLMVLMLVGGRRSGIARRNLSVPGAAAAAALTLLVILPLTTVQSEMGRTLWGWLNPEAEPPIHTVLRAFGRSEWGGWGRLQLLAGAVLIAPVSEELFFRGLLLQAVCRHLRHGWLAVAVSGIAFGLVHTPPPDVLPLTTMGLALGYLRLRCGRLWPCVLVHVLFNARTMTFVLLAPELVPAR
jgi:membrane protease YdiL (CAAX protease family)